MSKWWASEGQYHKCQNWYDARQKLGGHPVLLSSILSGESLSKQVFFLEKNCSHKRSQIVYCPTCRASYCKRCTKTSQHRKEHHA